MVLVYADVFLVVNIVVHYVLLYLTALWSGQPSTAGRLLMGALAGAAYGLGQWWYWQTYVYHPFVVLLFPLIMLMLALRPNTWRQGARAVTLFYLFSGLMAGMVLTFEAVPVGLGTATRGQPVPLLMVSAAAFFILLAARYSRLVQREQKLKRQVCRLNITFDREEVLIDALVDTGNVLRDPLTDAPVIVVEYEAVRDSLPVQFRWLAEDLDQEEALQKIVSGLSATRWATRLRMIPYLQTGQQETLVGLRPKSVSVNGVNMTEKDGRVVIGLMTGSLGQPAAYRALIPPELAVEKTAANNEKAIAQEANAVDQRRSSLRGGSIP